MKTQSPDTHPEMERILIEGYRKMPDWRKFQCIRDLNQSLREMQWNEIREKHPEADEQECRLRLASRWIEPELMRKAFGWDPEERGY